MQKTIILHIVAGVLVLVLGVAQATIYTRLFYSENSSSTASFKSKMIHSNVRSSLSLQVILYFNRPISFIFVTLLLFLYFFKVSLLPYATGTKICELLLIVLFIPNETMRLYWARKGNLTETSGYLSFALLLNALTLMLCAYWAIFQNYVLFLEFIVVSVEAFFVIIETILEIFTIANFSRFTSI